MVVLRDLLRHRTAGGFYPEFLSPGSVLTCGKIYTILKTLYIFILKVFLQKHYSYDCIKSKKKHWLISNADDSATVKYLKALSLSL